MAIRRFWAGVGAFATAAFLGSLSFWWLSVVVRAAGGDSSIIFVLSPFLGCGFVVLGTQQLVRRLDAWLHPLLTKLAVLLGVTYLGIPWMMLAIRLGGDEMDASHLGEFLHWGPVTTWVMSTYDGSLFGFALVLLGLTVSLVSGVAKLWSSRVRRSPLGEYPNGTQGPSHIRNTVRKRGPS